MLVYRLAKEKYALDLSGEGSKLYGGRWNSVGTPMLYAASSRSLAVLELLVNLASTKLPEDMFMIILKIDLENIPLLPLPQNWQSLPFESASQRTGDNWVKSSQLATTVPSVVIPEEQNILLNPLSSNFGSIVRIIETKPFYFDKRLMKGS
ncbi:MAG: RES family NAD+ phosphorylase [Flavobacteriales bacterium]|nr:RES family NAD+ phosphorylase [Flavobacteriales bacterium]